MNRADVSVDITSGLSESDSQNILDVFQKEDFDNIVELALQICKTPFSVLTFVNNKNNFNTSLVGSNKIIKNSVIFSSDIVVNNDSKQAESCLMHEHFFDNLLAAEKVKICFCACMPLISSNGYKFGALSVLDVNPLSLSAEQSFALKVLSEQIVRLIELKLLNKQVTTISEAQQNIISVICHDIRSPLTSVKMFLDVNAEQSFSTQEKDIMLSVLTININRTLQLLSNLIEWSKIQLLLKKKSDFINLNRLVSECINQAELNASLKNNKIVNEVNADINITTNKEGILFILRNLISNANKFTENGTILISDDTKENHTVCLCVKDDGIGIETSKLNHVLEESGIYHTDGTQHEKGSGLGLSLVKTYLKKTGNDIYIENNPDKGISVCFSITAE